MVSESARYYQTHPAARERKKKYDTRFESSPTQKAKRRELARHNAEHDKKYGSASRRGMDASHTKSGIRYKPSSVNRGSKTDMAGDGKSCRASPYRCCAELSRRHHTDHHRSFGLHTPCHRFLP